MAGATMNHHFIVANVLEDIAIHLKGKPCRPLRSDMRIHIPANSLFTYPDITIICDKPTTLNNDNLNVLNPSVIIEVMSPSTRNYDQGQKFSLYRTIPSLKEYLLIDSTMIGAASYHINATNHWELQEYKDLASSLTIKTIDLALPLSDIYQRTELV